MRYLGMLRNRKSSFWMCSLRPDVMAKERPLSDDDKLRKAEIIRELNRITLLEKVNWRQKSRAFFLRGRMHPFFTVWLALIEEIIPLNL
jgi:hypothetical protein